VLRGTSDGKYRPSAPSHRNFFAALSCRARPSPDVKCPVSLDMLVPRMYDGFATPLASRDREECDGKFSRSPDALRSPRVTGGARRRHNDHLKSR